MVSSPSGGTMANFRAWCAAMESTPRSLITLSNVAYDVVEHPYAPPDVVRKIVDRVVDVWAKVAAPKSGSDDADDASDLLSRTLDSAEEDLFCQGKPVTLAEPTSSIVDLRTLEQFYVRNTFRAKAIKPHVPGRSPKEIHLTPERIKPKACVRTRRPFAWMTKAAAIDTIERALIADGNPDAIATHLRDYLGLDHLAAGCELFEMRYPLRDAFAGARIAAPTFVEGACKDVYRSNVNADGWGRAVDLSDRKHSDGGPEVVHTPIAFTSEFRLRHIGMLASTRVCSSITLQTACPRRWQTVDVEHVERYIS
jgi:hypothetical protein